jgi:amino-acid N-acetyltransferase
LHAIGWQDLGEIKSLVVEKKFQNQKIGSSLVKKCLDEAKELGVKKVFALTFVPHFFKKLGFKEIEMKQLPTKIWSDCVNCVYFPNCKEKAVTIKI